MLTNGRIDIAILSEKPEEAEHLLDSFTGQQDVTVRRVRVLHERSEDWTQVVTAIIDVVGAVGISVLSNWIWENLRGRSVRVRVNRREIDLDDRGQIQKIIEEEIEYL